MNWHAKHYEANLYPFQDGVLNIVKKLSIPCYLTGGTALSRGYFNHRYSDDLDLFMNQEEKYADYVQQLFNRLEAAQAAHEFTIDYQRIRKYENFAQFFVIKPIAEEQIELKLDVVNDIAAHYGGFEQHAILGCIDSWQNILSNKLSALFRFEAKDVADIWVIAKHRSFHWMSILEEAKTKEAGIDPIVLYEILKSFPEDALKTVKWSMSVMLEPFKRELDIIADDILHGRNNTLAG